MDTRLRGLWQAFVAALDALGLESSWNEAQGAHVAWGLHGTIEGLAVAVALRAVAGPSDVESIARTVPPDVYGVLVAKSLSPAAKASLTMAGIGFFDGGGHLRLWRRPLLVDSQVPRALGVDAARPWLRLGSPSLLDVALAVLTGGAVDGVRAAALALDRSPGTVSKHLSALRQAHLVSEDREPIVPNLFEAVSEVWHPARMPLADLPRPGRGAVNQRLRLGFEGDVDLGWTLADASAAAAWGAPVVLNSAAPPDFYVPDKETLRLARTLLGHSEFGRHACTVAVAPSPYVCRDRHEHPLRPSLSGFPAPSPIVAALDLAADPARGREVLALWSRDLAPEVHRVW